MSYDFDGCADRSPPIVDCPEMERPDAILMVIELAVIFLSPASGCNFNHQALLEESRTMMEMTEEEFDSLVFQSDDIFIQIGEDLYQMA